MSKRRTPRGMRPALEQLRHAAKPGAVTIAELQHDDACPAWRTQRSSDCQCEPNIVLRQVVTSKKGGQP